MIIKLQTNLSEYLDNMFNKLHSNKKKTNRETTQNASSQQISNAYYNNLAQINVLQSQIINDIRNSQQSTCKNIFKPENTVQRDFIDASCFPVN